MATKHLCEFGVQAVQSLSRARQNQAGNLEIHIFDTYYWRSSKWKVQ
jgi:hypothetical protein